MEQKPQGSEYISTYQSDPQKDKFSSLVKYLIASVLVVLIVLAGVYFYSTFRKNQEDKVSQQNDQSPNITKISNTDDAQSQYLKKVDTQRLKSFYNLMTHLSDNSIFLEEANFSYTISGKVKEVKIVQEELNDYTFSKAITMKGLNSADFIYYFTEEELNQAKVYVVNQINATETDFSEIKTDDIIVIEVEVNLIDTGATITKISIIRK